MGEQQSQPMDIDIDSEQLKKAGDEGLPTLTVDFIKDHLRFGPAVPEDKKIKVCGDVSESADVPPWNVSDLGCMQDVPMGIG